MRKTMNRKAYKHNILILYKMLSESDQNEILQTLHDLIDDYLEENGLMFSKKTYLETMVEELYDYLKDVLEDTDWDEANDDALHNLIWEFCSNVLPQYSIPMRQHSPYTTLDMTKDEIAVALERVNKFPVQTQRSVEWYAARTKRFSASNLWKLFGSPAQYNSLIYEKCKAVTFEKNNTSDLLLPNPRNWGIRYEPITVLVYEHKHQTRINTNYGSIPHEVFPVGASPDGIVCDSTSEKYGHMVEIKNIFNREIDGIPSEEYWIQMQTQMEVCRLEKCDFVETRFKEYASRDEYINDDSVQYKGVIAFLIPRHPEECEPQYEYMPLEITDDKWWAENVSTQLHDTHILYQKFYWYLDEYSCTEVERNDLWFRCATPKILEGWNTVIKEREEGYEHRAPQKRERKGSDPTITSNEIKVIKLEF